MIVFGRRDVETPSRRTNMEDRRYQSTCMGDNTMEKDRYNIISRVLNHWQTRRVGTGYNSPLCTAVLRIICTVEWGREECRQHLLVVWSVVKAMSLPRLTVALTFTTSSQGTTLPTEQGCCLGLGVFLGCCWGSVRMLL